MPAFQNLKTSPLFKNWSQEDLSILASKAKLTTLSHGESIFSEGEAATSLYVVLSGTIKIHKSANDNHEAVTIIGSGSHLGEFGLLAQDPSSQLRFGSAEASEPTQLLEVSYQSLNEMLEAKPELAAIFYKALAMTLAVRIRRTTEDLAGLKALRLRHV